MNKTILSTGEFARLCRTTKATLFHYEKLGLLTPKHIADNGYRRYGIEQFFDFEKIAIFKETGSSLEEIGRLRDNLDDDGLLNLLEEKKRILRKERERLAQREAMLETMVANLREARSLPLDQFMIRELEEEYLEITPASEDGQNTLAESVISYAAYVRSGDAGDGPPRSSFGIILDESILNGAPYHELYYFSRSDQDSADNFRKPAGKYIVAAHKGDFASHLEFLRDMGQWREAQKLRLCGRIYAYDLPPQTVENYLTKYVVQICTA